MPERCYGKLNSYRSQSNEQIIFKKNSALQDVRKCKNEVRLQSAVD